MQKITERRWLIPFALAGALFLVCGTPRICAQGNIYEGPIGVTGIFNGNVATGCSYDPLTHSAHREITDMMVPGSIGKYPLKMTRYYNSRQQYYALNAIGLGPGWAHEYSWLLYTAGEKVVSPYGNAYDFHCGAPVGVSESWDDGIQGPHPTGGTWRLSDGGKVHFNGGQLDYIEDPYGLRTTIEYVNGRRWRMTEPGGRCLIFTYGPAQDRDGTQMLTKVEAFDYNGGHRIDWVNYTYQEYNPVDPLPPGRQSKMMLKTVTYSDGTSATYDYTYDNVPENGTSHKMYPLLQRCGDVRYGGPMRTVSYDYQNGGPHGAITAEKYPNVSAVSSILPGVHTGAGDLPETFTETRGDGPSRSFSYTPFHHYTETVCDDYENNIPPQQMLQNHTDFQGHTTWIGYDHVTWYVTSVTDARGTGQGDPSYTTSYQRGPAPPQGIGQIKKITHPDTSFVKYDYEDPTPQTADPHYVTRITDERGNKTEYTRDANHRITQTDYKDFNGSLLARETFSYCDQADANQCGPVNPMTGQMHGKIKTHLLKNGGYVHYRYDSQGRGLLVDKWEPTWSNTANENDAKTHYTYYPDGQGDKILWTDRVKTMTGPPPNWPYTDGPTSETYEYDRTLGVNGITNLSGAVVAGRGFVTKITHADGTYQRFAYDAYGNKRWEDNELRKASSYTYDEYNRPLTVTKPLNDITTYTYNPTNGTGSRLSHTTNFPDTVTVRTSATTNIVTNNVYDENFRKTSSTAAFGTPAAATTWFHSDSVGNQDYVTDPRGSSSGDARYTTYTDYDSRNRKWRLREPLGRTTQFLYEDKINVTRIIRPDQTVEIKSYDGMNHLRFDTVPKTASESITTEFQYYQWNVHSASLLSKVIDGESHGTTFEYDPSGLKTKMTYQDGSYRTWAYDDAHNLKSRTTLATGATETQNFGYDNRNRKILEWWDGWPTDGEWRAFGYDDANHLTLATNGLGAYWSNFIADVRRSYDDAGRLTQDQQTVYVNGTRITKNVNYSSYDDDGKLLRMFVDNASPTYDYTFSYDAMGRFEKIFATRQTNPYFQYQYDPASNEKQRDNLFNGISQIYLRDELNRMTKVELTNDGAPFAREVYDYWPIGRLHTVTRQNNLRDQFDYFLDGELKQVTYNVTATPPPSPTPGPSPTPTPTPPGQVAPPTFSPDGADYVACANSYTFNVMISSTTNGARIRWTTDATNWTDMTNGQIATFTVGSNQTKTLQAYAYVGATNSTVHSANYSFERECAQPLMAPTYPLDNVSNQPMAPELAGTYTYTLDKAGNRTSVNGTSYSLNTINQYTAVGGTPIGNGREHEISDDYYGFHYTYMRDQELTRISAPGFSYDLAYDALGRCVKRTVNNTITTYYIYDGEKPILEYNANNALVGFNLYGKEIDEIIERGAYGADNQWHWYFLNQDHEGSVTHLTDASGNVIERYRYDAFGAPTIYAPDWTVRNTSSFNNRFLFTGREYVGAWIYEYRARAYHSGLGRFMSEDPKLFDAGDYNLFRYCHNDPIDFTDPMGTQDERQDPWYTHAQQAEALDRLAATRELLGLSSTYIRAALSSQEGVQQAATVPNMTRAEAIQKYGPYVKGTWTSEAKYIMDYPIPKNIIQDPHYNMRWDKDIPTVGGTLVTHFSTNRDIAGGITAVLENLQRAGKLSSLGEFNGSFFFRTLRTSSSISAHAYGLAIDVNGSMNPQGHSSHQPAELRAAFTRAGFVDGGTWPSPYTDAMHFSVGF